MADPYPMGVTPTQESLSVNPGYTPNLVLPNVTYSTPCNLVVGCVSTGFFIAGSLVFIFLIVFSIIKEDIIFALLSFFPLIFIVASFLIGTCFDLGSSITVDHNLQIVNVKTKKMCFCFTKTNIIQLNEIRGVIARIDHSTTYEINGVPYNAFEIIFQLVDGRQVSGCSGVINKNDEGIRAASILRKSFPPNIIFSGDLIQINLQHM